jgi:NADP-dependent 3-hydroxy acid dehydrogenase YdfG
VNNAGIFRTKPFTDFTTQDFNALVSTNLLGFLYITQLTVKKMLKRKSGNILSITATLVESASRRRKCLGFDDYGGGLNAVMVARTLAR